MSHGRELISTDPLAPGSVYAASVNSAGKVGLYRIEVGISAGTGKLKHAGGADGSLREAISRAFAIPAGAQGADGHCEHIRHH